MNTNIEDIVHGLGKHFEKLGIEFVLIGALARDLICQKAGIKISRRRTDDVDFGIMVDSWDTLETMRQNFEKDSNIKSSQNKNNKVRYYYNGTPFDLVPFGGVEKNGTVSWRPFYDTVMTVYGYKEALASATNIQVGKSSLKIVTPEMLVGLKIVAWNEDFSRRKDATDIRYIMSQYQYIDRGIYDTLVDDYPDILEHFEYNDVTAGYAVMGHRIQKTTNQDHTNLIVRILGTELSREKLARQMVDHDSMSSDDDYDINLNDLNALLFGLTYS